MKNHLPFDIFLKSLKTSNRTLDFFTDWQKCLKNKNKISIALNHLNFLLGKDTKELKNCIKSLFKEYPKAFNVLNILIAVRDKKDIVLDANGNFYPLYSYFEDGEKVYEFIRQTGLERIFCNRNIKDLNDFVFGIEVGLDSNARKNRSGKVMENHLSGLFTNAQLNFKEQVEIREFEDLCQAFGDDIKKFDFVVCGKDKTYFIEANFYTISGSKLNEVARSYQDLALKFEAFPNYEFIWITDGIGWLDAKNKLQEAYKSVEIYNLSNVNDFISKAQKW
ncbi:type II restriction endonuclease [Helicobacter pylori]|uniref:Type-2 restriction enzyme n=2 Tax=Helicobacter pylori TaxID=210 RepID=O24917_HELPY|nr:type II restriction endonuclease [Helicobacter pylori]AAD07162.1 type II restriction enzyme R protein (hsdR) [Helicobacter pylori 26695]AFV41310.1 type II restriction enzyme R protein (hsdR) [Helicobacter pylori 26695]AFV42904.1 type II restriction enzyme R protein (hsdR) [Helicobacter pylori Rif1]AFV44499.1 type II restriction enzyme R protein (hsdR) [Helicobacter pylori Rif2]AJF08408.1 restriction endonuclease MboI [Helicobacter pylori 26695-1]